PPAVIGTFSIIFSVLQSRGVAKAARTNRLPDRAFARPGFSRPKTQPANLLIFGPAKGRFEIDSGGEFQPPGFFANHLAGALAPPMISSRKSNSAAYGPQGPRRGRRGCLGLPPRHLKEWCNTALYARGQRAGATGYRPAPAAPRWY